MLRTYVLGRGRWFASARFVFKEKTNGYAPREGGAWVLLGAYRATWRRLIVAEVGNGHAGGVADVLSSITG
jgi:hypothetical protein